MSRETENALLLLLGLSAAIITVTGVYTRYVKPSLMPWLAAVAVLLLVLAVSAIIRDLRRGRDDGSGPDEHPSHAHRRGIGWLIAVPVLLLAFVVPPALGAQAAAPLRSPCPPASYANRFRPCRPGAHRKSRSRK